MCRRDKEKERQRDTEEKDRDRDSKTEMVRGQKIEIHILRIVRVYLLSISSYTIFFESYVLWNSCPEIEVF